LQVLKTFKKPMLKVKNTVFNFQIRLIYEVDLDALVIFPVFLQVFAASQG